MIHYKAIFDALLQHMCLTSLGICIKNCSIVKQWNKVPIIQLLDKCLRDNKIAPLQHVCLASLSTCTKMVQFYCPSRTYPAIPYCTIFPFLAYYAFIDLTLVDLHIKFLLSICTKCPLNMNSHQTKISTIALVKSFIQGPH